MVSEEGNPVPSAGLLTDLTPREQELIDAARQGKELACSDLEPAALAVSVDPRHVIRAQVLRELLIGRRGVLDPRGIRLVGARIVEPLDLDGVHAVTGLWLGGCVVDESIEATFATLPFLVAGGGQIAGLVALGLQVDGSVLLADMTIAGSLELTGAHIAGHLALMTVTITNAIATGFGADGVYVGGDLQIGTTEVTNVKGSALVANRMRVDGGFFLRERVRLTGHDTVGLAGAHISGHFGVRGDNIDVEMTVGDAPVLDLQEMTVATTLALPPALICPAGGRGDTCTDPHQVRLEHLSYLALGAGLDWRRWLHVIRCHTPNYHASPYQQLAAVERAAGHDGNVRQILIAQQKDLRRRAPDALGGWLTRFFHSAWGMLAGYGYRARRTAAALLLVLVVAGGLGWWAGQVVTRPGHHVAERVAPAAAPGVPCSFIELVGLGLDRGLPLGLTGLRARCDLDTTAHKGQAFTAAIWGVQLAVWGLATLALVGYTNLVRKTS